MYFFHATSQISQSYVLGVGIREKGLARNNSSSVGVTQYTNAGPPMQMTPPLNCLRVSDVFHLAGRGTGISRENARYGHFEVCEGFHGGEGEGSFVAPVAVGL